MRRLVLIMMAGLLMGGSAFGWGREGHETIAKVADNHLKPSARKVIEKYLGDHSIVYYIPSPGLPNQLAHSRA